MQPILVHTGIVEKGQQKGRTLGFPTANLPYKDLELTGAYAGRVAIEEKVFAAVIYANKPRELIEAHLFDVDMDLYGKTITVELLEKVGESKKFTNLEALKSHIAESAGKARNYFIA